jgi:hypothetical protein
MYKYTSELRADQLGIGYGQKDQTGPKSLKSFFKSDLTRCDTSSVIF